MATSNITHGTRQSELTGFSGELIGPDDARLRRGAHGLQRDDRPPARA